MILDQVGVTLSVQSIAFTNRQDWYTVQYTNSAQRKALCSALTSGNGFEVYCVNEIQMPTPPGVNQRYAVGLNSKYGTILGAIADDNTLAHEIGHQLGWKDIYPSHEDSTEPPVLGPISPTRLPDDWTGVENWYPREMQQAEAITRLLMYGMSVPSKKDIPSGSVYGITYQYLHSNGVWVKHWHTLLVDIGRDSWNGVVLSHQ